MLSLPFWAAFAVVFFGLKWLAETSLALPGPKRELPSSSPRRIALSDLPSAGVDSEALRKAA